MKPITINDALKRLEKGKLDEVVRIYKKIYDDVKKENVTLATISLMMLSEYFLELMAQGVKQKTDPTKDT